MRKKAILRVSFFCSALLFTFLLSACGGGVTPPTNTGDVWSTPNPGENTNNPVPTEVIRSAQTTSGVDTEIAAPTDSATTFQAGDAVYVTYELDLENVSQQSDETYGNVKIEYYNDGELYKDGMAYDHGIPSSTLTAGYFGVKDYPATAQGQVKIYWCNTGDCSDPQLAHTLDFTVE